jgi:predicted Zn-dependent protease
VVAAADLSRFGYIKLQSFVFAVNEVHTMTSSPCVTGRSAVGILLLAALFSGCASTTQSGAVGVERKQFLLVSQQDAERGAATFYAKEKQKYAAKGALNRDPALTTRVRGIAQHLINQAGAFRPDARNWNWEVNVLQSSELNAYCAAGGKIAVYSGLVEKLKLTDDELASVMGHEIAHALREHSREAMSEAVAQQMGIAVLGAALNMGSVTQDLLDKAATVAIQLPNSRGKETEADRIGLELTARAGYDPRGAVSVWKKMMANGGGHPPEFLSTHPNPESRMQDIENYLPRVMPLYEEARKKRR